MYTTIITPIYKGESFIPSLLKNIENIARKVPSLKVEWVLVNDYPDKKLLPLKSEVDNLSIEIVENEKNLGIQGSRIEGFKHAKGEYVIFLDQDDVLSDDTLAVYSKDPGFDVYLANGDQETDNAKNILFKNRSQQKKACELEYYFYIGNLIASPGMTMIKKSAVPECWLNNLLEKNGADDWLLWSSLLEEPNKIKLVFEPLYLHSSNSESVSNDTEAMIDSSIEALEIFKKAFPDEKKLCRVHEQRLKMRKEHEIGSTNKALAYLQHPVIALMLIRYKLSGLFQKK